MNNLKYIANHLYQLHIAEVILGNSLQKKGGRLHLLNSKPSMVLRWLLFWCYLSNLICQMLVWYVVQVIMLDYEVSST